MLQHKIFAKMMNKNLLKTILVSLSIVLCSIHLSALHIIGGDVTYECLGKDTVKMESRFKITFTMYRDSRSMGAPFDSDASFGIYRGSGNSWQWHSTISGIDPSSIIDIPIENGNPCVIVPVNLGVQRGIYEFTVTLPMINESFMIAYQRCCRNNTILNLNRPGDTGAAFTTEISSTSLKTCNNSPRFKSFPPAVICVNRPINFDHSAIDIDGDSLVYEFCTPLTAGGTDGATTPGSPSDCTGVRPDSRNCLPPFDNVVFNAGNYSFDKPMAGDPLVTIRELTGLIVGSPNFLGQHVVGVCVKEYRNGVLIGTMRRDFQFNVTTCEIAVSADIKATSKTNEEYFVNSCGEFTINFVNKSTDVRYIQNYFWEFNIQGRVETYNTRDVAVTFPGLGIYKATMILNKDIPGSADCLDTASITVNVYPSIDAEYEYTFDTCKSGPIAFKDFSKSGAGPILRWGWDFGEGKSQIKEPVFEYENPGNKKVTLVVEDVNKCRDTIVKDIKYFPIPSVIVIDPNTFTGCQPAQIYFKNLTKPIDSTYQLQWSFGDGLSGSQKYSPTHTYEDVGIYTVKLDIVSPLGCQTTKVWNNLIKVVPSPMAGFEYTPEQPTLIDNVVQFIDKSKDAISYLWQFDESHVSNQANPSFIYQDTGVYEVLQIVLHPSGCSDTARATVIVLPFIKFFVPNAFTPNEDGLNDKFLPVGIFEGIRSYDMSIWNRWGEQVFETVDYSTGWNGQRGNTGDVAPPGVYAYVVNYKDELGKPRSLKGHVTLIR
jgi:gliding motility-associated-like protein